AWGLQPTSFGSCSSLPSRCGWWGFLSAESTRAWAGGDGTAGSATQTGSAVAVDQQASHRLAPLSRLRVALGRRDDRALHQDVPRARKRLGITQTGLLGKAPDQPANPLQVEDARAAGGVL